MNIRSIARKPFYDIFHLYQIFYYRNPIMPQILRFAMSDGLSYDPLNKTGGPFNNFPFSKFKKAAINTGLGVYILNIVLFKNHKGCKN